MQVRLPGQCLIGLAAMLLISLPTFAQTTFGSIVGNVNDASGAAVAGTDVSLTNLGTNEKRISTTNADGLYQFVNLNPGQYSVEVAKTGFRRVVQSPVTVETQSTTKIDLVLQLGDVS